MLAAAAGHRLNMNWRMAGGSTSCAHPQTCEDSSVMEYPSSHQERYMSSTSTPKTLHWPEDRPNYTSLAAAIQGEAARWNVPGISAGILHDGETKIEVTGTASIETGFPVTEKTIFQIGSISK